MENEKLELINKLAMWLCIYLVFSVISIMSPIIWAEEKIYMTHFVFSSGVVGGCLSIQQRIKRIEVDELKLYTKSWATLIIFPLTGGILALLLYVTFLAELIQGDLFPNFYMPDFGDKPTQKNIILLFKKTVPKTGYDFCKILFWSFIAGFSERFVIRLIHKTSDGDSALSTNH